MRTLGFENGDQMPIVGLGTWQAGPDEVGAAVTAAVEVGYRHIDCAPIYGNEPSIGAAMAQCLRDGVFRRDEVWVTSKLWNDAHAPGDVRPALERTLAALRLDYLDLYLIHWPVALRKGVAVPRSGADFISLDELPISETWQAMREVRRAGLCRHIGVSNFSVTKMESLIDATDVKPEVSQVELHPYLQQRQLVHFCRARDIHVTAYASLGSRDRPETFRSEVDPDLLGDRTVAATAKRLDVSPAQVLLAWAITQGVAVIPKTVDPARMAENLAATEVSLTAEDFEALRALDRGRRYVDGGLYAVAGSGYTLAGIWDG